MQTNIPETKRRLEPGRVVITPAAMEVFERFEEPMAWIRAYLERHLTGDWGNVNEEDAAENERSVAQGWRILSSYEIPLVEAVGNGADGEAGLGDDDSVGSGSETVWIITEADRDSTCLLLPTDY